MPLKKGISFCLRCHSRKETVSQFNPCHSGQAKRDPESRNIFIAVITYCRNNHSDCSKIFRRSIFVEIGR